MAKAIRFGGGGVEVWFGDKLTPVPSPTSTSAPDFTVAVRGYRAATDRVIVRYETAGRKGRLILHQSEAVPDKSGGEGFAFFRGRITGLPRGAIVRYGVVFERITPSGLITFPSDEDVHQRWFRVSAHDTPSGSSDIVGPSTTHPVLLLPVRLETRFKDGKLLVRFYPDQICVDAQQDGFTQTEYESARDYASAAPENRRDAWRVLSARFGPSRAARLASWAAGHDFSGSPPEFRIASWVEAPKLMALPAEFHVFAYRGGVLVHRATSKPVRTDRRIIAAPRAKVPLRLSGTPGTAVPAGALVTHTVTAVQWALEAGVVIGADGTVAARAAAMTTTPVITATTEWSITSVTQGWESVESTGDSSRVEGLFDEDSKWMVDFPTAVEDGFALEIGPDPDDPDGMLQGFDRVVAVGLQWSDPLEGQEQFEALLRSHRFTDGLAFVPPGAPTNNTEDGSSGYTSAEDHDAAYEVEIEGPPNWDADGPRTNGRGLADALGVAPAALQFIRGAGDIGDSFASAMNAIVWPATGDYYFRQLLAGSLGDAALTYLADHHRRFVRGAGPLPSLRIGRQPYGVLPVTRVLPSGETAGGWAPWTGDAAADATLDGRLHAVVARFHTRWLGYALNTRRVPRVVPRDSDPDGTLLKILAMEPRCVSFRARPFVDERFIGWLLAVLRDYAFGPGTAYEPFGLTPTQWMSRWSNTWKAVQNHIAGFLATLSESDAGFFRNAPLLRILGWFEGQDNPIALSQDPEEPELPPSTYLVELCEGSPTAANTLLVDLIQRAETLVANDSATAEMQEAICALSGAGANVAVDRLFRESMDITSHRVDAWVTSFATKRLEGMRADPDARDGLHLGAYGFVEDLRPREDGISEGYVHAPSSSHAAACAVLYNAFLTHDPEAAQDGGSTGAANPFRINLTSGRVRCALQVLEGVREGQPLGALLGYQFERALQDRDLILAQYIDDLRDRFPLVAHKVTPEGENGETTQSVAARNVVDGAALARAYRGLGTPSSVSDIAGGTPLGDFLLGIPDHADALLAILRTIESTLDAVGDVLTTESVYQAVQGNYERAGAALDAAAGNQAPPEPECVATPVPGRTFTHRVGFLFNDSMAFSDAAARAADPRAAIEPRIAAWFAALLGPLAEIGVGFDFWEAETDPAILARVNVNTAGRAELTDLPGIGDAFASTVVLEREAGGSFRQLSDLTRVSGITAATVAELHDAATTGYVELVNLNTAPADSLVSELGFDDAVAQAIVEERAVRPFDGIGDVARRTEIDRTMLDALRGRVMAPLANINTAPKAELEALPGVGSVLAQRIIESRSSAPFSGLHDLIRVEGFNDADVAALASFATTDFGVLNVAALGISAADFLYIAQTHPDAGATELEQWVARHVRDAFDLPGEQRIEVHAGRHGSAERSMADAATLAQQALRLLASGHPMTSDTMCHPSAADADGYNALDVAALRARVIEAQSWFSNADDASGIADVFAALAAPSTAVVRFTGVAETVVPAGTPIRHLPSGTIWTTDSELVIAADGSISGTATTVNPRPPVAIPAGSAWVIEQSLDGCDAVLSTAATAPHNAAGVVEVLLRAARVGVPGILPEGIDDPHLAQRFENGRTEVERRLAQSRRLTPPLDGGNGSAPTAQVRQLVSAMKALFGEGFVVLPTFVPIQASNLTSALDQDVLNGLGEQRLRLWMQQAAEVRERVAELENTLMFAEAWSQTTKEGATPSLELRVAQLPYTAGRAWIGLSDAERGPEQPRPEWIRSPLSLVAVSNGPMPAFVDEPADTGRVVTSGLVLDEWSELIPDAHVNTSVAFQYDAPNGQAPQSLLLAVPSQVGTVPVVWTPEALAEIVGDTIDLAKVRAVDIDALAPDPFGEVATVSEPIGAILPGIYLPADPNQPGWERDVLMNTIDEWVAALTEVPPPCVDLPGFVDGEGLGETFESRGMTLVSLGDAPPLSRYGSNHIVFPPEGIRLSWAPDAAGTLRVTMSKIGLSSEPVPSVTAYNAAGGVVKSGFATGPVGQRDFVIGLDLAVRLEITGGYDATGQAMYHLNFMCIQEPNPVTEIVAGAFFENYVIRAVVLQGAPSGDYTFRADDPLGGAGVVRLLHNGSEVMQLAYNVNTVVGVDTPYRFSFPGYFDLDVGSRLGFRPLSQLKNILFDGRQVLRVESP